MSDERAIANNNCSGSVLVDRIPTRAQGNHESPLRQHRLGRIVRLGLKGEHQYLFGGLTLVKRVYAAGKLPITWTSELIE